MKALFSMLASVMLLIGLGSLVASLIMWDLAVLLSGCLALLNSYAWGLVGSMWERLERLEKRL